MEAGSGTCENSAPKILAGTRASGRYFQSGISQGLGSDNGQVVLNTDSDPGGDSRGDQPVLRQWPGKAEPDRPATTGRLT